MSKIDLYKLHRAEYATPKKPSLVDIKPAQYLSIRGNGRPGGDEFQAAIGALYNVAFTVKMASKFAGQDYGVCKLEGLWGSTEEWTLLIRTPEFIHSDALGDAITKLKAKGKSGVGEVRLKKLDEGRCVQVLYTGSYSNEGPTIDSMAAFASERGCRTRGDHHEIYLSDPRRVAPERLRTILRRPVRQK
jgi:hypothetical protein